MTLIEEIKAIDGYDALTDQQAADSVNAARLADQDNYVLGTYLTERGLYDLLGPEAGETVIATLEAAGSQNPALARVAKWLSPNEGGLDVGNAKTQAQLIALSDANGGPLAAASVFGDSVTWTA